ncbi:RluA family pseudouridine synthase [Balneolales bacterium ANBcel1]|nr:RluA family pseudouridine synthase [Balneolales bacterium ANBcel1]
MNNEIISDADFFSEEERGDYIRYDLVVPEGHREQMRLDKYITGFIQNATRNKVQEGIRKGWVRVNGHLEKASYRVQPLDEIAIVIPKPPPPEAVGEDIPIDVVYEDDTLLVVDKPPGMVVHPSYGNWTGTLVNALLFRTQKLSTANKDDAVRPGIVHRLDKGTSGLLVVAKSDYAHHHLSKQFADKTVDRVYRAVLWGSPQKDTGSIDKPLGRDPSDRKKMAVVADGQGKEAVTHFEVLKRFDHLVLVDVILETGRTHQIRVHCSWLGHPVLGDPVYGGNSVRYGPNTGTRKSMFHNIFSDLGRQCLHARILGFEHPDTGEWLHFESPLPDDMERTIEKLTRYCT